MDLLGCGGLALSGKNSPEPLLACCRLSEGAGDFPGVEVRRPGISAQRITKKEHLMSSRLPLEFGLAVDRGERETEEKYR